MKALSKQRCGDCKHRKEIADNGDRLLVVKCMKTGNGGPLMSANAFCLENMEDD